MSQFLEMVEEFGMMQERKGVSLSRRKVYGQLFVGVMLMGCQVPQVYDISSSVLVQDEAGSVIQTDGTVFCYFFEAGDVKENIVETNVRQCTVVEIVNGVALLPNLEGEFYGDPMNYGVVMQHKDQSYSAVFLDDDEDVWCDNVDVDHDAEGNVQTTPFCIQGFEFYQLWSVVVPENIF